jgi:hypothetical protein
LGAGFLRDPADGGGDPGDLGWKQIVIGQVVVALLRDRLGPVNTIRRR